METLDREDLKKALKGQFVKVFTVQAAEEFRVELNKKLEALQLTYGIKLTIGRMRINPSQDVITCQLKATLRTTKTGASTEKNIWDRHCLQHGLLKEDYGAIFTLPDDFKRKLGGKTATICGISTVRRQKMPVKHPIKVMIEGKTWSFSADYIRKRLRPTI